MIEVIEPSLSELVFTSYDGDVDEVTGAYDGTGYCKETISHFFCFLNSPLNIDASSTWRRLQLIFHQRYMSAYP
jgi:hypothetical protein